MPASARELDEYRERVDRFVADLDEEYYLHFAGLKETLDLAPIYDRYADLTTLEKARSIGESVNGSNGIRELWRFACEGYLGQLTKEFEEKVARLEAELKTTVDGEEIGFRMIRPAIANASERSKRERLERARNELVEEHLNPIYLQGHAAVRNAVREFGAPNYFELYKKFGFDLESLAEQCRAFLDSTERLHEKIADKLFRDRVGVPLAEAERWDTPRMMRGSTWDEAFPADRMIPALRRTLADLGVDLDSQENVHLDVENRPLKDPRAFCAPIEVPGRVMLVIKPIGGPDDWGALFHEAGHAEHYAHTSADLAVEDKRLGDNAVTEGWAMLFELVVNEPAWLERRLDFARPGEFASEAATGLLYFVRRYAAKFLYELELHGGADLDPMRQRYVERMYDALKIEVSAVDYLADVDPGFYSSSYLRAWTFESALRGFLREEFGRAWFTRPEAGSLLRELWSEGQRPTADELIDDVADAELELAAVAERIEESVAA